MLKIPNSRANSRNKNPQIRKYPEIQGIHIPRIKIPRFKKSSPRQKNPQILKNPKRLRDRNFRLDYKVPKIGLSQGSGLENAELKILRFSDSHDFLGIFQASRDTRFFALGILIPGIRDFTTWDQGFEYRILIGYF